MYLFIITHLGSGDNLTKSFESHPRIVRSPIKIYKSPKDLLDMKTKNAQIFFDVIEHNYQIQHKEILKYITPIYLVREPSTSLIPYSETNSVRYYCFRLRRICEIAKKNPSLLVTAKDLDLEETYSKITYFLGLKLELKFSPPNIVIPNYGKHYQFLKSRYETYLNLLHKYHANIQTIPRVKNTSSDDDQSR